MITTRSGNQLCMQKEEAKLYKNTNISTLKKAVHKSKEFDRVPKGNRAKNILRLLFDEWNLFPLRFFEKDRSIFLCYFFKFQHFFSRRRIIRHKKVTLILLA